MATTETLIDLFSLQNAQAAAPGVSVNYDWDNTAVTITAPGGFTMAHLKSVRLSRKLGHTGPQLILGRRLVIFELAIAVTRPMTAIGPFGCRNVQSY